MNKIQEIQEIQKNMHNLIARLENIVPEYARLDIYEDVVNTLKIYTDMSESYQGCDLPSINDIIADIQNP